jgi:hypothetical protein
MSDIFSFFNLILIFNFVLLKIFNFVVIILASETQAIISNISTDFNFNLINLSTPSNMKNLLNIRNFILKLLKLIAINTFILICCIANFIRNTWLVVLFLCFNGFILSDVINRDNLLQFSSAIVSVVNLLMCIVLLILATLKTIIDLGNDFGFSAIDSKGTAELEITSNIEMERIFEEFLELSEPTESSVKDEVENIRIATNHKQGLLDLVNDLYDQEELIKSEKSHSKNDITEDSDPLDIEDYMDYQERCSWNCGYLVKKTWKLSKLEKETVKREKDMKEDMKEYIEEDSDKDMKPAIYDQKDDPTNVSSSKKEESDDSNDPDCLDIEMQDIDPDPPVE